MNVMITLQNYIKAVLESILYIHKDKYTKVYMHTHNIPFFYIKYNPKQMNNICLGLA